MLQLPAPRPAQTFTPLQNPVVVLGPHFLANYPVELVITKKVMTLQEGQFEIKDVGGTTIFTVKGSILSISDKRVLCDALGNPVATLRQKLLTAHSRWIAYRGDSTDSKDQIFTVKKSSIFQIKRALDVFLTGNNQEQAPDFHIKGAHHELGCTVYLGKSSTILAQMHRQHSLQSVIIDKDTYGVTVTPNVDYAFMAALVVILHEINADSNGED